MTFYAILAHGHTYIIKAWKETFKIYGSKNVALRHSGSSAVLHVCHITVKMYAAWKLPPLSSSACSALCLHICTEKKQNLICVSAYFKGLVFHFHDELLLLLLAGAGVLELGFDVVDLHLILHHCSGQQEIPNLQTCHSSFCFFAEWHLHTESWRDNGLI